MRAMRDAIEVVDERNVPLCIMPQKTVLRRFLRHRKAALLIRDARGRALLTMYPDRGWGFTTFCAVRAGFAVEEEAQELLYNFRQSSSRLFLLGINPPCPENGMAFISIFEAELPAAVLEEAARDMEQHLLVDYDELKGLNTHSRELLSPFLHVSMQRGYVRPR